MSDEALAALTASKYAAARDFARTLWHLKIVDKRWVRVADEYFYATLCPF